MRRTLSAGQGRHRAHTPTRTTPSAARVGAAMPTQPSVSPVDPADPVEPADPPDAVDAVSLHERVLDWYAVHARDLPWRRPDATPWAVLVSEFMLQQTPVNRVLPVYEGWLRRWPNPADLVAAGPGEAVRAWG